MTEYRQKPTPSELEIENLLFRLRPTPGDHFHVQMEKQPWNREKPGRFWGWLQPQWRVLTVSVGIVFILLISLSTPSIAIFANRIAQFFLPASNEHTIVEIPWEELEAPGSRFNLTVAEAAERVGFGLKIPSNLPTRFTFTGAAYSGNRQAIIFNYGAGSHEILRISQQQISAEFQSISTQTGVEMISIEDLSVEYVAGGWRIPEIQDPKNPKISTDTVEFQAIWDSNANIHFLRWQENDILYEIFYRGDNSENQSDTPRLGKDALLTIAVELQPYRP